MTEKKYVEPVTAGGAKSLSGIRTGTDYRTGRKDPSGKRGKCTLRGKKEKCFSGLF